MAGCAEGIWALQDVVQPFYPVGQEGIFAKILQRLSKCKTKILMMDATHLKVHRTAASLKKGGLPFDTSGEPKVDSAASYMPFATVLGDR
jgi:hypothetical protein